MGPSINYVMPKWGGLGLGICNKLLFAHLKIEEINGKNMTRGEGVKMARKRCYMIYGQPYMAIPTHIVNFILNDAKNCNNR